MSIATPEEEGDKTVLYSAHVSSTNGFSRKILIN